MPASRCGCASAATRRPSTTHSTRPPLPLARASGVGRGPSPSKLLDNPSASAAEAFTAALQESHRARVVGVRTYGRGQAQLFVPLPEGLGLVVPTLELRTPRGRGYKGEGLQPDVEVAQEPLPLRELGGPKD